MRAKKNRYVAEAVRKMIKARDLEPRKDAKGGLIGLSRPTGNPPAQDKLAAN